MEIVAHLTHKAAMMLKKYKLHEVATFELSNVDKKSKDGEQSVRLCNFTDVYYNWAVTRNMEQSFMLATASESQIKKLAIQKGQVAITKDSETRHDIGIPTYIADDFENTVLGYHCALITPDQSKVDGRFLNAFLNSKMAKEYFANNASGSGMRYSLPVDAIKNILLYLPELEVQKRIGHLLSIIDRKIALNREINRNLEAVARQLYDYWFVQFDFPDRDGKPYKSSGRTMVWNEKLKREIPIEWAGCKLSDIANITMGQSPEGTSYNEVGDGVLFYQGSTDFGDRFPSVRQYTTAPTRFADKGDILMSVRAPVGALNIANNHCCIGRGLSALSSKIGSQTYLYYVMDGLRMAFEQRNDSGTTFGSITKEDLHNLPTIKPQMEVLKKFGAICSPIFDIQMNIGAEIYKLSKQRDELLPLLMNGQVSVRPRAVNCDLSD